jgi:hypothetical protein
MWLVVTKLTFEISIRPFPIAPTALPLDMAGGAHSDRSEVENWNQATTQQRKPGAGGIAPISLSIDRSQAAYPPESLHGLLLKQYNAIS